jgi:uncharacterized protein
MIRAIATFCAAAVAMLMIVVAGPWLVDTGFSVFPVSVVSNAPLSETIYSLILYGIILVAALAGAWVSDINALALGTRPVRESVVGFAVGSGGTILAVSLLLTFNMLTNPGNESVSVLIMLWGAAVILMQCFAEEVFFRGWMQKALGLTFGWKIVVPITAFVFAAAHFASGAFHLTSFINLYLGGLLFGMLAYFNKGIAPAVTAHFGWNMTEQLVFGVDPNPGVGAFGSIANFDMLPLPYLAGTAEFGLNGSIAMTIALLSSIIILYGYFSMTRQQPKRRGH